MVSYVLMEEIFQTRMIFEVAVADLWGAYEDRHNYGALLPLQYESRGQISILASSYILYQSSMVSDSLFRNKSHVRLSTS